MCWLWLEPPRTYEETTSLQSYCHLPPPSDLSHRGIVMIWRTWGRRKQVRHHASAVSSLVERRHQPNNCQVNANDLKGKANQHELDSDATGKTAADQLVAGHRITSLLCFFNRIVPDISYGVVTKENTVEEHHVLVETAAGQEQLESTNAMDVSSRPAQSLPVGTGR